MVDYRIFKIGIFRSYESTSESSSDIDSPLPSIFSRTLISLMICSSFKHLEVDDYATTFTTQEMVDFLCKGFNLLGTSYEVDVISEPCSKDEHVNLVSLVDTCST